MKSGIKYLFAVFVLISFFSINCSAREPLSFEQRVKAQEAIERVYYNHRIWPKENPQPKPPFEKMVTKEQIEAKVTDYLKKSAALGEFWQRPLTGEELQAEMERMAKGTKDPQTLNELFKALNDDPYLIAEYLARPILADRLVTELYFNNEGIQTNADGKTQSVWWEEVSSQLSIEDICLDEGDFMLPNVESYQEYQSTTDTWTPTSIEANCPLGRYSNAAVWTGTEMIVWGGYAGAGTYLNSGGMYKPSTDSWQATSTGTNCPSERYHTTAVWTGTEMIVWGGSSPSGEFNTGGRYNPSTNSWQATSTGTNCPSKRNSHTAVWTGTEMIIWGGGSDGHFIKTGGRYNAASDSWGNPTSTSTNCPSERYHHTAVWTGSEMIVWGGWDGYSLNSGGRYNPSNGFWFPTSTGANVPDKRENHTAVWTGSEMIIWGGPQNNTGGKYNPLTDSWTPTSEGTNCPSGRIWHTACWTGSKMIVWGGSTGSATNTGGIYTPSTDTWVPTSVGTDCPSARSLHTVIWTGTRMIVWGGYAGDSYLNTGGVYSVDSTTCSLSCTATVPSNGTAGAKVNFSASATPSNCPGTVSYNWVFGDGETSTSQNPTHTYIDKGTYEWTMTASVSGDQCSKTGSIVISSGTTCSLSCTTTVPANGAVGELILFHATVTPSNCSGAISYFWDFGDGETASANDPQYSYADEGTYSWSMTASVDGKECSQSGTISISKSQIPVIYSVGKATNPFRLIISGGNFMNETSAWAWVYINGVAVPQTKYKSASKLVAKGAALKAMVPKGVTVQITVKNPDGTFSEPYAFQR